jgi:beta-galactosidase
MLDNYDSRSNLTLPQSPENRDMPHRTVLALIAGLAVFSTMHSTAVADGQAGADGLGAAAGSSDRLKQSFDLDWRFIKADPENAAAVEFDDRQWRQLDLPHDFSVEGPVDKGNPTGTRGGFFPLGTGWYRKQFTLPDSFRGKRIILRFDGVMYFADVYINGRHLGRESNPYLSRDWDITDHISSDGTNVVAVRADTPRQMERWYTGCGIYRHVWLMAVEPIRVREFGTYITTPVITDRKATVEIKTTLLNQTDADGAGKLETILLDPAGKQVARGEIPVTLAADGTTVTEQRLEVASPQLWSIETPNLYRAVSRVWHGERQTDQYHSTFGIRTIAFDAENGFSLNGRRVVMSGACLHQDIGALGAAVPDRAIERRLEVLRAMGVNAIRTSHNPYSIEFLDLCDRMGFVVIDEAFDKWHDFRPDGTGWRESLLRFLDRDCNHPSIVLWSVGNEVGQQLRPEGVPIVKAMVQTVHTREPTRPVTCAMRPRRHGDGRLSEMIHHIDVVSLNYQSQLFEMLHKKYPKMVLLGGETTPYYSLAANWTSTGNQNSRWLPVNPWFQVKQNICGQFLWTGCDYLGEAVVGWPNIGWCCSPIDTCGRQKDYSYFIKSVYSDEPMVRIVVRDSKAPVLGKYGWHWPPVRSHWNWDGHDGPLEVYTFTNAARIELLLNGKSLGVKRLVDFADRMIRWEVPNDPGSIVALARNDQEKTVARHQLNTAGPAHHIALEADRRVLRADGQDLSHVRVRIVDRDGNLVPHGEHAIQFAIEGNGRIVGVDSGNLYSHEPFKAERRTTYQGYALAIIRAGRRAGTVQLAARADGLEGASVTIQVKAAQ